MKQILLTSILALFLSVSLYAQTKKPAAIKYYSQEVLNELKATSEQQQQIKELLKEANAKSQDVKKDESLSEEERKIKLKEIISTRSKAYFNIITPEQKARLDEMKKELAEKNEN